MHKYIHLSMNAAIEGQSTWFATRFCMNFNLVLVIECWCRSVYTRSVALIDLFILLLCLSELCAPRILPRSAIYAPPYTSIKQWRYSWRAYVLVANETAYKYKLVAFDPHFLYVLHLYLASTPLQWYMVTNYQFYQRYCIRRWSIAPY